jgi:hypothetical protein
MGLPAYRDPDKRLGSAVTTDSWRVRVCVRGVGTWAWPRPPRSLQKRGEGGTS